jgi:hypothetical protein
MRFGEVTLQRRVVVVVHMLVIITAQVACEVHSLQVIMEEQLIKEELLAKITPRMWQNFSTFLRPNITIFNVVSQRLYVVNALLSNEDCATGQANLAKSLLVSCFHVASQ